MSYFSLFQSPHPVRGATGSRSCWPPSQCHFNPRTPRGVRLGQYRRVLGGIDFNPRTPRGVRLVRTANMARLTAISIHAPREGCDRCGAACFRSARHFNPRTPRGVRPSFQSLLGRARRDFNPRTPRGVRRDQNADRRRRSDHFNPRTPRGVRQGLSVVQSLGFQGFQSTHPARGATFGLPFGFGGVRYFNPRTPRGVRRKGLSGHG